jgi:hypothetical protein
MSENNIVWGMTRFTYTREMWEEILSYVAKMPEAESLANMVMLPSFRIVWSSDSVMLLQHIKRVRECMDWTGSCSIDRVWDAWMEKPSRSIDYTRFETRDTNSVKKR